MSFEAANSKHICVDSLNSPTVITGNGTLLSEGTAVSRNKIVGLFYGFADMLSTIYIVIRLYG